MLRSNVKFKQTNFTYNYINKNHVIVAVDRTVAKAVFAGGALYVTVDQGVWSTSPQASSKALTKVKTSVIPVTSEYIEKVHSNSN